MKTAKSSTLPLLCSSTKSTQNDSFMQAFQLFTANEKKTGIVKQVLIQ